jgi:hypothetical protein
MTRRPARKAGITHRRARAFAGAITGIVVFSCLVFASAFAENDTGYSEGTATGDSVSATAMINGIRLIVVDHNDTITGIWSNTSTSRSNIVVREGGSSGADHPLNDAIAKQYNSISMQVDWGGRGQVFRGQ